VGIPSIRRKSSHTLLWGELAWHPAAQAWTAFMDGAGAPDAIEVLHDGGKRSATYRLVGAAPGGGSIIARRAQAAWAGIARTVHQHILRHLPITTPRYCGSRREGRDSVWLFFQTR
jgi:hypothetical protein